MDPLLLLSKVLSYGIILGAVIVKLPQIIKIVSNRSVKGLVLSSIWLETIGLTVNFAYSYRKGFAFSTYGETLFILVQNIIIIYLVYSYTRRLGAQFVLAIAAFAAFAFLIIYSDYVSLDNLAHLQKGTIPLFSISKIPQIWANFKNSSVGQLSLITTFLQFAGSGARVFTTIKEVSDPIILVGYCSGTVLNGALTAQCVAYKDKPVERKKVRSGKQQ